MKARRLVYKIQGALAATSSSSVAGIVVMLLSPRWSLSPQGRLACETAIRYWQLQILDTWTCIRIRHTSIQTCMYVSIYIYIHTRLTDFLHIYRPSRDHSQIPRYKWECLKIRSAPSPQIFIENAMFGALLFWSTSTLFFLMIILYYTIIIPVGITYTHWKWIPPLRATQIALVSEGSGGIRKGGGRITRPHHPPIHFCNSQTFFNNHVISRRGSKQRFGSGTWLRPSPNMFWIGCDLLSRLWRWCCGASTAGWVCFL